MIFFLKSPISIFNLPFSFFSFSNFDIYFLFVIYILVLYSIFLLFYFFDQWILEVFVFIALFFLTWFSTMNGLIAILLLISIYAETVWFNNIFDFYFLRISKNLSRKIIQLTYSFIPNFNYQVLTSLSYLFLSILFLNILGILLPTPAIMTSIIYTLSLTLNCFAVFIFLAFNNFGASKNFVLSKMDIKTLKNILFSIEILSFLARFISLPVRLFSNIFAGHVLIKLISVFTFLFISSILNSIFLITASIISWLLLLVITAFEITMAIVQAYVLTMLLASYYSEYIS